MLNFEMLRCCLKSQRLQKVDGIPNVFGSIWIRMDISKMSPHIGPGSKDAFIHVVKNKRKTVGEFGRFADRINSFTDILCIQTMGGQKHVGFFSGRKNLRHFFKIIRLMRQNFRI